MPHRFLGEWAATRRDAPKRFHSVATNLVYQTEELLQKEYYVNCDMSKYIALLIDTLNHDSSISKLLNPVERINRFLAKHNANLANKK